LPREAASDRVGPAAGLPDDGRVARGRRTSHVTTKASAATSTSNTVTSIGARRGNANIKMGPSADVVNMSSSWGSHGKLQMMFVRWKTRGSKSAAIPENVTATFGPPLARGVPWTDTRAASSVENRTL
jgi:hypothetical protein